MGCNSSKLSHHVEVHDETPPSTPEKGSPKSKTCPYDHASVTSSSTVSSTPNGRHTAETQDSPENPAMIFLSYLLQTIFLFIILGWIGFGAYKLVRNLCVTSSYLQNAIKVASQVLNTIRDWISTTSIDIDATWILRNPLGRWDTNDVGWDLMLKLNNGVVGVTLLFFALDLLFSSPKEQGNWQMMLPAIILSIAYTMLSIHAEGSNILDHEIFLSSHTTLMGGKLLNQPEVFVFAFTHRFALDLACSFAFMKDFYSRVTSRRMSYRLLMIPLTFLTPLQGIASIPVYLLFRQTLFLGPGVWNPRPLPTNRNSFLRSFEYLYDPIPEGGPGLTGWISRIPAPFRHPLFAAQVTSGLFLILPVLTTYLLYVVFICLPVTAVFFSLRRSYKRLFGMEVQGAVFGPFETLRTEGKLKTFPKAVILISSHLRLLCIEWKDSLFFNILFGWWLRNFLEIGLVFEFFFTFIKKRGVPIYVEFLMEEFGPVFPFGQGLGFGKHKDVKAIIENPHQRKGAISVSTEISDAQRSWSKNQPITLPTTEIEKGIVDEGRELTRLWLQDVGKNLKDTLTKNRLNAILPYKNVDGSLLDEDDVKSSFGSTLFHLLTNGELTSEERKAYCALVKGDMLFASDLINRVFGGGMMQHKSIQRYDIMRKALLRYLEVDSLQRVLEHVEKSNWDAWNPPEVVRFLTYIFCVAGNAAPAQLLWSVVKKLYNDRSLVKKYQKDKRNFILEFARLERCVPMTNFVAHDFELNGKNTVTIFDNEIDVSNGTRLHCSIMSANRDKDVFGEDASELNFDRDRESLGHMMTFNGNENDIRAGVEDKNFNSPPRRCPGFGVALDILVFLVDRFCPEEIPSELLIKKERLAEIEAKQTFLQTMILRTGRRTYAMSNKFFAHASDVTHPLHTLGIGIGALTIQAAGTRDIPEYDEDVRGKKESIINKGTSLMLSSLPINDDEGEWKTPYEAIAWRKYWFKSNFPPCNIDYSGVPHAEKIESFAFAGISCFHTKRVDNVDSLKWVPKEKRNEIISFVNDNTDLGAYRVRYGYQRYGAAAYFDEECNLVGIYTSCDNKYHERPTTDLECQEWCHAMWVWRVSALALATVADHLVNVHLVAANTLVSSCRGCLPIDHPIRCFLKIFTYKTISINNKAYKTLFRRNGVVSRNWAFQYDDLQEAFSKTKCTFKKKFEDHIPSSMKNVSAKKYPANHDLTQFSKIVRDMVAKMLGIIYGGPGNLTEIQKKRMQRTINNDKHLQNFLKELANGLGLIQLEDLSEFDDIVDVLSSLICTVTAMHEHVGQISDFFADPRTCGTTIRRGKQIDSIQIYQLNCTLISSTGLRMPRLMGNWNHLLESNRFADSTVEVMNDFQDELRRLSKEIDEQNLKRPRKFRMESFNPVNLESSVSV